MSISLVPIFTVDAVCSQMDKRIKSTCSKRITLRDFPLLVVKSVSER